MLKVVIPEHIPALNKGEAAILEGILNSLSPSGSVSVSLYSPLCHLNDDRRNYAGKVNVVSGLDIYSEFNLTKSRWRYYATWGQLLLFSVLVRVSRKAARAITQDEFMRALADADVILAGHDGKMGPYQGYLVLAGCIMGKPVALFGGGRQLEQVATWKTRRLFQFAVNHAVLCTVRDRRSLDCLLANGVDSNKVYLFPDPAVLLRPCENERVRSILRAEGIPDPSGRPLLGLVAAFGQGLTPTYCFSAEPNPAVKHRHHVDLWTQIVQHFLDTTSAHIVFIPHCTGPTPADDDRRTTRDILSFPFRGKERITAIENEYSASELKGLMRACDLVVSERAHAMIGAFSAGTPCIALAAREDGRMHGILGEMFGRTVINLNEPDIAALKSLLLDEWNRRRETAAEMAGQVKRIHEQAEEAARMLRERTAAALGIPSWLGE